MRRKIYKIYEISRGRPSRRKKKEKFRGAGGQKKNVDKNVKNLECSKIISTFAVDMHP